MAKLNVYRNKPGLLIALLLLHAISYGQYRLDISSVDRTPSFISDTLRLRQNFSGKETCVEYVKKLPDLLQSRGYPNASVDSVAFDSAHAYCVLYSGEPLGGVYLVADSVEPAIRASAGLDKQSRRPVDISRLKEIRERMLIYLENNGYPFASINVDSFDFGRGAVNDSVFAVLKVEKGPLYRIDSIRNQGTASISSTFLQQYLGLRNGSIYRKDRLMDISGRIRELPFLTEKQRWDLSLLGTGSVLNVYLEPKKSSEVNVLVGLLPANNQLPGNKLLITGEANINLKNALGGGETIGVNWQQIQVKSPRLNLLYVQPYLFGSSFGMNLNFDLLKKDSSYVNISMLVGAMYSLTSRQTGTIYLQRLTTNLLTVDTFQVKNNKRLPEQADVSSVNIGLDYERLTTDYRFNPRKGNEFSVNVSAGTKSIKKNNAILKLRDDSDPSFDFNRLYDTFQLKSFQFRVKVGAANYFPIGRASTIKAAVNGGWFQSPSIFRNELFQIGGYKLLRGFDEESIFSSAYGVTTVEYRYLLGQNSFLSAFADYGISANSLFRNGSTDSFLGAGLGMAFETKAGIFNISYAAGKRQDQQFNLRQSKIHLGYVNYF